MTLLAGNISRVAAEPRKTLITSPSMGEVELLTPSVSNSGEGGATHLVPLTLQKSQATSATLSHRGRGDKSARSFFSVSSASSRLRVSQWAGVANA